MKKIIVLSLILFPVVIFQIIACNNTPKFKSKNAEKGYLLARRYCVGCHMLPEPSALNKETWLDYVLPKMGALMGFTSLGQGTYFIKKKEAMPLTDWNNIVLYYYLQSPKYPVPSKTQPIQMPLPFFVADSAAFSVKQPATTMVNINANANHLLFADGEGQMLYDVTNQKLRDSFATAKGVAGIRKTATQYWVLSLGVLYPSDEKAGTLITIDLKNKKQVTVLDSLQRPVDASYGDVNQDGLEDIVICEFGNTTGALSWYKNNGNNHYTKQVLRALPGAVKSFLYDFNKDGLPDIIALMAQGDEGVFVYYNLGKGRFKEERLLQFPPSYGSNSMQLIDFNKDGFIDLLTTNGDNGDYPPILKAYHGLRLFINDGKNNFTQQKFLPVHGVGKAIAADFDKDGDLDIASISYFPDFEHTPWEAFVYWQNNGKGNFTPHSFSEAGLGRWIVMDAADIDGDGDEDIVLGNANFRLGNVPKKVKQKWDDYSPSYLVLKNMLN